jgi:riboflavin kinase/FMN adenylyltransferase
MNIGINPTVNGENLSIEVHFLDFDTDLYDNKITISILDRIREEQKFESVALLKLQLEKDKTKALSYIKAL